MNLKQTAERQTLEKDIQLKECYVMIKSIPTVDGTSSHVDEVILIEDGTNSPAFVDGANSSCIDIVSDDVWLHVFSYLPLKSLFSAENVCQRWKDLVDVHFKSRQRLTIKYSRQNIISQSDVLRLLRRCGLRLRELSITDGNKYYRRGNILMMIGDTCPNLVKLTILGATFVNDEGLMSLAVNCNKLQYFEMHLSVTSSFSSKTFIVLLKSMKQLKRLSIPHHYIDDEKDCFKHIAPTLEDLELSAIVNFPRSIYLDSFPKLKNLRKLQLSFDDSIDDLNLERFAEVCVNLKDLSIIYAPVDDDMLIEISKMLWLERLDFSLNVEVNDDSVELLVHGSPDLKAFSVIGGDHSWISDAGVKHIVDRCQQLVDLDISRNRRVTDMSLLSVAERGIIRRLAVRECNLITDKGCIDLVTLCPQLELLDIRRCSKLTNAILLPSLVAVRKRFDKRPLKLMVAGTKITKVRMKKLDQSHLIIDYIRSYNNVRLLPKRAT